MPKLREPSQFGITAVPSPPLAPMTMTEGPTRPEMDAPELGLASAASLLQGDEPLAASLPRLLPGALGLQGPLPGREGELAGTAGGGSGLPYLRQAGP